ncbi:MAG: SH3 domain-containing protein, partial [Chlamydiia bacterium]|nr:SH3 domain-containing protein [Chlamydiia bacterium]
LTGARRIQSERQVASVPLTPFALLGPLSKLFWVCAVILFFLALRPPPYRMAVLVAGSLLLLFGALVWIKYVRPAPAFVVEAVALRAAPNQDAPLVLDRPLFAAEGVSVLEVVEEGAWLKVRTADGTIGFGPAAKLRMLLIGT